MARRFKSWTRKAPKQIRDWSKVTGERSFSGTIVGTEPFLIREVTPEAQIHAMDRDKQRVIRRIRKNQAQLVKHSATGPDGKPDGGAYSTELRRKILRDEEIVAWKNERIEIFLKSRADAKAKAFKTRYDGKILPSGVGLTWKKKGLKPLEDTFEKPKHLKVKKGKDK